MAERLVLQVGVLLVATTYYCEVMTALAVPCLEDISILLFSKAFIGVKKYIHTADTQSEKPSTRQRENSGS